MESEKAQEFAALAEKATQGEVRHIHKKMSQGQDMNALLVDGKESIVFWTGFDSARTTERKKKANAAFIAWCFNNRALILSGLRSQSGYVDGAEKAELVKRLREACVGHPHAKIPWPHYLLHEAADMLEKKQPVPNAIPTDTARRFLAAVEALCDWLNGTDISADHAHERPDDFKRLCDSMEEMQTAIRALPLPEPNDGWRGIESAPKDGSEILGYDPIAGAQIPIWFVDGAWQVCWTGAPNPDCTHWRPLPEPPIEEKL